MEVWQQAEESYQNSKETVVESENKNYSITVDSKGHNVVVLDENIYDGKFDWEKAHEYIANFIATEVGKSFQILSTGQEVFIGKDLPKEFTQSKYTQMLRRNRPQLLDAKNQTVQNLKDIVQLASDVKWEKNTKKKHDTDAKYGFYKYTTWFGVLDKQGRMKEYCATLVVRRDANKKSYLYDITDIKKVGTLHLASASQGNHSYIGESNPPQSNPTINRIAQNAQNATKKYSDNENDLDIKHSIDIDRVERYTIFSVSFKYSTFYHVSSSFVLFYCKSCFSQQKENHQRNTGGSSSYTKSTSSDSMSNTFIPIVFFIS